MFLPILLLVPLLGIFFISAQSAPSTHYDTFQSNFLDNLTLNAANPVTLNSSPVDVDKILEKANKLNKDLLDLKKDFNDDILRLMDFDVMFFSSFSLASHVRMITELTSFNFGDSNSLIRNKRKFSKSFL